MDTSRILTVVAYVPLIDEEFPTKIELGGKVRQPDFALLREEFSRELKRMAELQQGLDLWEDKITIESLSSLESSSLVANLRKCFDHEGADFDAILKAERELLEFKVKLDEIGAQVVWPSSVKEADGWLADLDVLVGQQGTSEERTRAKSLRDQVRAIIAEKNGDRLKKKIDEIADVYSSILYRQGSFWVGHFEALAEKKEQMSDQARAKELLQRGRAYAAADNLSELKDIVFQLQDLLPRKVVEQVQRGYGSGLVA